MSDRAAKRRMQRAQANQAAKASRAAQVNLHPYSIETLRVVREVHDVRAALGPWLPERPFGQHMPLSNAVEVGIITEDGHVTAKGRKYNARIITVDFADGPFPVVELP